MKFCLMTRLSAGLNTRSLLLLWETACRLNRKIGGLNENQTTCGHLLAVYQPRFALQLQTAAIVLLHTIIADMDKLQKPSIPLKWNVFELNENNGSVMSKWHDTTPRHGARPENLDFWTQSTAIHCVTEITESHYQWTKKTLADISKHNIQYPKAHSSVICSRVLIWNQTSSYKCSL